NRPGRKPELMVDRGHGDSLCSRLGQPTVAKVSRLSQLIQCTEMARVGGPVSPGTVSRRRAAADATHVQVRLTAPRSELGRVVARHLAHTAKPAARPGATVLVNLAAQAPNTLLHDGHAWRRLTPRQLVAQTRRMLADPANRDADYIVHASYAFLDAVDDGAAVGDRLVPIVAAAREAEAMVLGSGRPAC